MVGEIIKVSFFIIKNQFLILLVIIKNKISRFNKMKVCHQIF